MASILNIGLDIGNSDVKTSLTSTPSGYGEYNKIPYGASEALIYEGVNYVPDIERFPYVRDKTVDEKCFVLSLFGIAKEIVTLVSKKCNSAEEVQAKIDSVTHINLGVGLPPAHISNLRESLENYYRTNFGNGISFSYMTEETRKKKSNEILTYAGTYHFNNLKLNVLGVYPQDLAAALIAPSLQKKKDDENYFTNRYSVSGYYAIDIGGFTVDVVPIINKRPRVAECVSLEYGVLRLCGEIEKIVNREFDINLSDTQIQNVLIGEQTALSTEVIEAIESVAADWVTKIINQIRRGGLEFNAMPVIFLGGGSVLLKNQIESNKMIKQCEHTFISTVNANACGFKAFVQSEAAKKG